jgi:hypothetical protein
VSRHGDNLLLICEIRPRCCGPPRHEVSALGIKALRPVRLPHKKYPSFQCAILLP